MRFSEYTNGTPEHLFETIGTSLDGLSKDEHEHRLKTYGPNDLSAKPVSWFDVLVRQVTSPFIYILFAAVVLSFFLGEVLDASMILGFIVINTVLGFVQEYQSEHSLELLKRYVVSTARVVRDGKEVLVDSKTLVPGDIVKVETGDIVPADIRFIETEHLLVDESGLSGESVSITKNAEALTGTITQVQDALNIGFSGSKVVGGEGHGIVVATARETVMGDAQKLTVETKRDGLFEQGIARFSSFILKMIVAILVLVFVLNIAIKGGSTSITELVLFSIALAVSVIPEALPVVVTLSLSRGAINLAKNHVVVKRLSAIEDLGSIDVLCTDKTGTLTENKLAVADVCGDDAQVVIERALAAASFIGDGTPEPNNAFDLALWNYVDEGGRAICRSTKRTDEIPFDPERRRNSVLVDVSGAPRLIVRGAPETILQLSKGISSEDTKRFLGWVTEQGTSGKRVIAVAEKVMSQSSYEAKDEVELTFLGLISFVDPIKPTTKGAIVAAERLGLEIKIITGDNSEVAAAVAHEVGIIADPRHVITGDEIDHLEGDAQRQAVLSHSVFARVSPRQKYRIIELLKGVRRVGFLGEGINDAPALKEANVGLVVKEASDIARDAADIVLLDPSLDVIVSAIEDGREVFQNTVKYLKITLISNFGNFFSVAIALLIAPFLPMLPIQLLLLNLLTDFPMIAIGADNVDPGDVKSPEAYNINEVVFMAIALGIISTTFDFVFFAIFYPHGAAALQTNWFISSTLTELALVYSVRSKGLCFKARPVSRILAGLTLPAAAVAVILPFTQLGQSFFHFTTPKLADMGIILGVVAGYFVVSEIAKLLFYRWYRVWQDNRIAKNTDTRTLPV